MLTSNSPFPSLVRQLLRRPYDLACDLRLFQYLSWRLARRSATASPRTDRLAAKRVAAPVENKRLASLSGRRPSKDGRGFSAGKPDQVDDFWMTAELRALSFAFHRQGAVAHTTSERRQGRPLKECPRVP